ncbi:MAG: hypothetical protein KJP18_02010 [Gemmatimonadetes bacterium]|nr:hypothetical protein [Gemmatimonadota bacterium]NNK62932.1 hypothetical protein [Gemmatimonadota bacterium]
MRFAYIDSHGNEVEIPSADALRLRVELGAIVADTQLYDGASDRWASAAEHDLFRRIRRDLDGGGPSLPVAAPTAEDFERVDPSPWGATTSDHLDVSSASASAAAAPTSSPAPAPASANHPSAGAEATPEATPAPTTPLVAESPPFEGAWSAPVPNEEPELPLDPSPDSADGEGPIATEPAVPAGGDEVIDFSDFGVLELDDDIPVTPRSSAPPPDNPARAWDASTPEGPEAEADPWTVPGREPWPPPAESLATTPRAAGTAAHPFDADEVTPDWLRNDPDFTDAAGPDAVLPDGVEHDADSGADGSPAHPGGTGTIRRSPPKRSDSRRIPFARIAAGLATVFVLGAGAVWALTREGGAAEPEVAEIVLPPIAPSLQPVVRSVAAVAVDGWLTRMVALPARQSLPDGPDDAWLGGRYMASAGDFADVRLYWESLGRLTQIAEAREEELFEESLLAAIDSVALTDDDRAAVLERTRAGFQASSVDRGAVYDQLRAVVDASLTLHIFLEQNEANIDYEPADAGLSRDPVLEAVPITAALGDEMWNLVSEITSALDAVGFLDQVTTEGLLGVFFGKLGAVPVR